MQELFTTLATATEIAIALFVVSGVLIVPRSSEFAAFTPGLQTEAATASDPWELLASAPLFPPMPYLLPLPAATVEPPNWAEMNPHRLRQECQQRGIKWRNAHGKNKHLGKREMVEALNHAAIAA